MIDEQRADPFNRDEEKGEELLRKSLIYERARTIIEEAAQKVSRDRKTHLQTIAESGEEYDRAFDVALDGLRGLQHEFGAKSDKLWKQMEAVTPKFGPGLERLANAVLEAAAYDYEVALCDGFHDSKAEIYMIEKFASCGAEAYTTLNFFDVLDRIRKVYEAEWLPMVKTILPDLASGKAPTQKTSCPLCGGGLYFSRNRASGGGAVRCTTCGLSYMTGQKTKGGEKREK